MDRAQLIAIFIILIMVFSILGYVVVMAQL